MSQHLFPKLRPITAAACRHRRGGYLYIAVLMTSLIVMASVTAALTVSTSSLKGRSDRSDRQRAMRLAESELQRLAAVMRSSSAWRTDSTNDVFGNWRILTFNGAGIGSDWQVRHRYRDDDGSLVDDPFDPVELTVHARAGRAEWALSCRLEVDPTPLKLLSYGVTATDDLEFSDGSSLNSEWPVQVRDDCRGSWQEILTTPRLECGDRQEVTLRGDLSGAAMELPGHDVVAQYARLGTAINTGSIPLVGGEILIENRVLSPTHNPFGATDASGVYRIDAGGRRVTLSHCRLSATLVIRNSSEVLIRGGVVWNFPGRADAILVTDARIRMQNVETTLSEPLRSTNYNPSHSPFRGTLSNSTALDAYSSHLRGVIYTTDNVQMDPLVGNDTLTLTGALIGRDVKIDGRLNVRQLPELVSAPPQGLSEPTPMRFVWGTLRRIESPLP